MTPLHLDGCQTPWRTNFLERFFTAFAQKLRDFSQKFSRNFSTKKSVRVQFLGQWMFILTPNHFRVFFAFRTENTRCAKTTDFFGLLSHHFLDGCRFQKLCAFFSQKFRIFREKLGTKLTDSRAQVAGKKVLQKVGAPGGLTPLQMEGCQLYS